MSKNPSNCPSCGKGPVVEIIYGLISGEINGEVSEDFVLGGCCVSDNDPEFHCISCGYEFGRPREITSFIRGMIDSMMIQSRKRAFRSEAELQGFAFAYLSKLADHVEWDRPTTHRFKRGDDSKIRVDDNGRKGLIDFVITQDDQKAGLEIEYPRGKGREEEPMIDHFSGDCLKLSMEKDLDERYLLVFTYRDLNEGLLESQFSKFGTDIDYHLIRLEYKQK